jgi:hypothetical protein
MKLSKDALFSIGILLDMEELLNFCNSNDDINNLLCLKDDIWLYKIKENFPKVPDMEILKKYKGDRNWKEYYIQDLNIILNMNLDRVLHYSSSNGRLDLAIFSVGLGADPVTPIAAGLNSLDIASLNEHLNILEYFLNSVNIQNIDIANSMIFSSGEGLLEPVRYMAEYLSEHESNPQNLRKWFSRAYRNATYNNQENIMEYLKNFL